MIYFIEPPKAEIHAFDVSVIIVISKEFYMCGIFLKRI